MVTCGAACSLTSEHGKSAIFLFSEPYDDDEVGVFLSLPWWSRFSVEISCGVV